MDTKDKLIERLKELIKMITPHGAEFWGDESDIYTDLVDEIAALEKQAEEQESKEQIKEIIRQKINLKNANYDVCICSNQIHLVSREYCKKCKKPLKIEIEDEILKSTIEEQESKECDHPFVFVQTRCLGEINHCLKCGKDL